MGWQARLKNEDKPEFVRTCNKCGDTGVKKTFVAMDGLMLEKPVSTKCIHVLRIEAAEAAAKKAAAAIAQPNVGNQA